jgi:hypothetical protein
MLPNSQGSDPPDRAGGSKVRLALACALWSAFKRPIVAATSDRHIPEIRCLGLGYQGQYIAGFYLNPPAHAAVISIDEKGQIQTFAVTKVALPVNPTHWGHHDSRLLQARRHCQPVRRS